MGLLLKKQKQTKTIPVATETENIWNIQSTEIHRLNFAVKSATQIMTVMLSFSI